MQIKRKFFSIFLTNAFLIILALVAVAQSEKGNLSGKVTDQSGDLISNAAIKLFTTSFEQITHTDENGNYLFKEISEGEYRLEATKEGFQPKLKLVEIEFDRFGKKILDIVLNVKPFEEKVDIRSETDRLTVDPYNNKDGIVFREDQLDLLPDDPEGLEAALRMLAGSGIGPDGGEIFIDGFSSRNIPPKSSIREIRINQNPFSAEFDRIGFGRIQILTRAGKNDLEGSVFYRFSDDIFNARNPFALTRPPFQLHQFGGSLSGSVIKDRASFFADVSNRKIHDAKIVNARTVNEQFLIVSNNFLFDTDANSTILNLRTDIQANQNNSISLRYMLNRGSNPNTGVGNFSLPSQVYRSGSLNQTLQFAITSVISDQIMNELRFQFENYARDSSVDGSGPKLVVNDAFVGGSSSVGNSKFNEKRMEISNNFIIVPADHAIRFGARIRINNLKEISQNNFNGTFIFSGGIAPILDKETFVLKGNGKPEQEYITSIERYRRTLYFMAQGFTPAEIRELGGGAAQFTISGGDPEIKINQISLAGFVQDDWRVRPNLNISFGLRLETQNNISRSLDLAPRFGFAWSPDANKNTKFARVIRGGLGVFYSRFAENLVLDAERFSGNYLVNYLVNDAKIIDGFEGIPSVEDLGQYGQTAALKRISPTLRTPRIFISAIGFEQKLKADTVITATYSNMKMRHGLYSHNINALSVETQTRPDPELGEIYQFESGGRSDSHRLSLNFSTQFWKFPNIFLKYDLGSSKSDTDGATFFPINGVDLTSEYGRSSSDVRHTFTANFIYNAPFGIRLSPMIIAVSGRPFNIILGEDLNSDSIFAERPAFATELNRQSVTQTVYGTFDRDPMPGAEIIPRNFGVGTPFYAVSLRASRTFRFNLWGGGDSGARSTKRHNLNISTQVWNLFNRANYDLPVGNLSSPFFGRPVSLAGEYVSDPLSGSRVIEWQIRLNL